MKMIWICVFVILHFNAHAVNYYVSSKKGNTNNSGVSPLKPKNSIQDAADLTKPGDTVFVMEGTYTNNCSTCNVVNIVNKGTKRKYIVYTNFPNHKPVIRFDGWAGIFITNGASYIKITGFEVIGNNKKITLAQALIQPKSCVNKRGNYDPKFNGNGIAIDGRNGKHPHHIIVAKNIVHDCGGGGISATQADYITFEDNIVYNTSWYSIFGTSGISFYQFWNFDYANGYHNIIRRNKCFNNRNYVPWEDNCIISDGNVIIIDDFRNEQNNSKIGKYKGKTLIENNICWYNGGTGIHTFKSDYVDIINNTAYCNSKSPQLNVGQIIASISGNINIVSNILVSDSLKMINSNYENNDINYFNNLHYNLTFPFIKASLNNATCINHKNPLFIKPCQSIDADFQLQENSPAKNKIHYSIHNKSKNYKSSANTNSNIGAY